MLERPHIEYLQSPRLPWSSGPEALHRPGVDMKRLSEDAGDGACTALLRYPSGWQLPGPWRLDVDEEFLVLTGSLSINGVNYGEHDYAYLPEGFVIERMESPAGATLIEMFAGRPGVSRPAAADRPLDADRLIQRLDPLTLDWDNSGQDTQLASLRIARKILRLDPAGKCRTFLLSGMPQSIVPARRRAMEYHHYCEEMFLLSGDIACHCGIMRTGAYFWRPPLIHHGLECSRNGFLALMRIPGSNVNVNHWVQEGPVDFAPPYRPFLPPELERYRGTGPDAPPGY